VVGLAPAKNVVFDVLANDAGAVLVTAAEQVAAVVMVLSVCMNLATAVVVLIGVRHLSPFGCAGMTLGIDGTVSNRAVVVKTPSFRSSKIRRAEIYFWLP